MKNLKQKFILGIIILLAATFRFISVNWDQGQHLHPDERFLTMVGNAMRLPDSFSQYLDPSLSPMNPANINFGFFVYGVFPVTLNKVLAITFDADTYQGFVLQGRMLSAFIDLLAVLIVYNIVKILEKKHSAIDPSVKFFAAFFYAIAVLPIQLSHFFAVDTFLNTFLLASFYFALHFWSTGKRITFFLSIIAFSLALASKINGVLMLPLIGGFLATGLFMRDKGEWSGRTERKSSPASEARQGWTVVTGKKLIIAFAIGIIGVALAYGTLRLANPYLFETKNFLDPTISKLFLENLRTLKSWDGPEVWFPPGVQWIGKPPITFALFNLTFFGVGWPYFIFIGIGMIGTFRHKNLRPLAFAFLWAMLFFLYQSTQYVKNMRYFIILYPFLAIAAAIGFHMLYKRATLPLRIVCIIAVLIWPLAYISIYTKPHSRVQASQWIYENIPAGKAIAHEHWDDALPLPLFERNYQQYTSIELPVFDPDTPEKWQKMNTLLDTTDYYILSSNRAWGSIPTANGKYPLGTKFYQDLFNEKRGFRKIKEITSYPSLRYLGIPIDIPDDAAEESFTVYDHPKVLIFEKKK